MYFFYFYKILFKKKEIKFRLTILNKKYKLCDSYPKNIIVPLQISDEDIQNSSCYRTRNRIPTLCWYDKVHKSSIWRSSQTKCGITQQRNTYDELLLKHIAETSKNGKITIFDTRPYLTALYNKVI